MRFKHAPLFSLIILLSCTEHSPLSGSESEAQSASEYVIFGHFYGLCGGEECIEIFKLTTDALFEDANDFYPSADKKYQSQFIELDPSKFNRLADIDLDIPSELLNENKKIVGAPDAADGGGIYLELSDGRYWLLDMNLQYLPEYLHPLRDQIREAIAKINK